MAKYTVEIPYTGWKYYEVEARNEEEAKEKVFDENEISESISLCWSCAEKLDSDLNIEEKNIYVERE